MSPRFKALTIKVLVAGACALAAAALVTAVIIHAPAGSAVWHSAASDPLGVVVESIIVNILTS